MSSSPETPESPLAGGFVIRDGTDHDINDCMALDHTYPTDYTWQMTFQQNRFTGWDIHFKTERLPRTAEYRYPTSEDRLRALLDGQHGFIVAQSKQDQRIFGYLAIERVAIGERALLHDLVVTRSARSHLIGSRLLHIGQQWARVHDAAQVMCAIQSQNYPAIQFCQKHGYNFCGFNDQHFPGGDIALFFAYALR